MRRINRIILFLTLVLGVLSACSPLRKAGKDDYLLVKNKIIQEGKYKADDDIKDYVLSKPNKKLLGMWRLRLQIYNLVDQEKMLARRAYLDSTREAKNTVRNAQGKKRLIKERATLTERFFKFGEAPSIFDEDETKRSVDNMEGYLFNKGYFHGEIRDSVVLKKNRHAKVYYIINRKQPYKINKVEQLVNNERIQQQSLNWKKYTLIKEGDNFDLDVIDAERDRYTRYLRRKGFYFFNKEYIEFTADTGAGDHKVNILLTINEPEFNVKLGDSLVKIDKHREAKIRNIYVDTDYNPTSISTYTDTVFYGGFYFPYRKKLKIKPQIVAKQIIPSSGAFYSTDDNDLSYRNLSNMRSFRSISIEYTYVGYSDGFDLLDCRVLLSPAQKQSFGIDFQGTTTGAYPGLESNFSYRNRNAFLGAESFEFKIYARAESQRTGGSNEAFSVQSLFNTLEIGNEISIRVPKFLLPFRSLRYSKKNSPFTSLRVNNAYQTRPDYSRFISTFGMAYEWQETPEKFHKYSPLEFSVIRVQKTNEFEAVIEESNDLFLRNSFSDHILLHNSYSYSYSNFKNNRAGNYFSFRGNAQIGGNVLYLTALAGKFQKDANGRYTILNTPFAQFIRIEPDFRGYLVFNETHSLALRGLLGIGIPYLNSKSLPFEKSFSAGGAIDVRGWRARRLGPGSYNQSGNFIFDQFADLKLLIQAEYRLTVIKQIELGFFVDAGNIWSLNEDPQRPGANFQARRFLQEIAVGAGVGLRINLGFFIFRVDPGIPLYDPTVKPVENRWIVPYLKWKSVVWNFAINYPF